MSSILNTDLGELYNQWGERVAYNQGFQKQKIDSARAAGRDAFDLGVDRVAGRDAYFSARSELEGNAVLFASDSALLDETVGAEDDELSQIAAGVADDFQ